MPISEKAASFANVAGKIDLHRTDHATVSRKELDYPLAKGNQVIFQITLGLDKHVEKSEVLP